MATSPFQSNSLRGQGEEQQLNSNVLPNKRKQEETQQQEGTQQEEVVMTSRPVGQEGHCFFSCNIPQVKIFYFAHCLRLRDVKTFSVLESQILVPRGRHHISAPGPGFSLDSPVHECRDPTSAWPATIGHLDCIILNDTCAAGSRVPLENSN